MNETPAPVAELISRHFDETLPPHEQEQLRLALATDPSALLDFAATARVHAQLEALAPPLPIAKKPILFRRLAALSAAALLTGGCFVLFSNYQNRTIERVTLTDPDKLPDLPAPPSKPTHSSKRIIKAPASLVASDPANTDIQELLSRYYVPISPAGLTVPEALRQLGTAIREADLFNRPQLQGLRFDAGDSLIPGQENATVYSPLLPPMTVSNYLKICRSHRLVIEQNTNLNFPFNVHTSPPPALDELAEPITTAYTVSADFADPSTMTPPFPEGNAASAKLARDYGIALTNDESASFSSRPPTLTLHARKWKQDLFARLLDVETVGGLPRRPMQLHISGSWFKIAKSLLPAGFDEESGMVLTKEAIKVLTDKMAASPGSVNYGTPSVITRAGQTATVEVRDTLPPTGEWFGFVQSMTATPVGDLIKVEGMLDLGILGGHAMPGGMNDLGLSAVQAAVPDVKATHFLTEYELWLPDNSTGLFLADCPASPDSCLLICIRAGFIDGPREQEKEARDTLPI
ncbi:MAG: hypothetical protein JWL81_880, partial [Verrucomicrobiales bacterium]|nr:hypothetical protein [Verrucomicrobiales bacterium]